MLKSKKILVFALILSFLVSSTCGLSLSFADEVMNKSKMILNVKSFKSVPNKQVVSDLYSGIDAVANDIQIESSNTDGAFYEGERRSMQEGDPYKNDRYNTSQEELAELLDSGYTLEDIFKADEIGNHLKEDPKNILQNKKDKNLKWDEVEKEIVRERAEKYLSKLKDKHPQEFVKLQSAKLSPEEQFTLLAIYDRKLTPSFEQLLNEYQKNGEEALKSIAKNPKSYGKVSQEKMDKYGLTEKDVEGLTDDIIERMEIASQRANVNVKEFVKGHQKAKQMGVGHSD
ncbi:MAG TPA: hypothetical protein DD791_10530 [Syntrophomonas sp.]|jgi:hypothetical protein|nr:hypothetical protein [Syntrophomonas sp.]